MSPPELGLADSDARRDAVDPARNVVLEASAGTGKTRVLVERYVNLLRAGVDPDHILAITFTRKAAGEMRERIIDRLRDTSGSSELDRATWRSLKGRLSDIAISTIDAFCLSLVREFPLEADLDPGFELADDTEVPRLIEESLTNALRACRAIAREDDDVALVFAQLGERRLRSGLSALLDRRLVAPHALRRYLESGPKQLTAATACREAADRLREVFQTLPYGLNSFLEDGPRRHAQFAMLAADIADLCARQSPQNTQNTLISASSAGSAVSVDEFQTRDQQASFRALVDRLRGYFLTQDGQPRGDKFMGTGFTKADCLDDDAWKRHRQTAAAAAPAIADAIKRFRRDLNVVLSRGVWRIFAVVLAEYERTLDSRALLDFSGVLERAVTLLRDMDEFAQSRFHIEARYRHVLVDEFQDTSRVQWQLIAQLVRTWGEGFGAAADALPPSIFLVGDRKQSIYGFRDADVAVLDEAAGFIGRLRGEEEDQARRAISVSFRARPALLAFINDLFSEIEKEPARSDAFRYEANDRFPIGNAEDAEARALGMIVADTIAAGADRVADEIVRLLSGTTVRDRTSGVRRAAQPADIAILFRSRDSHREFEKALERRGVSTYVYKGLGFFDADEVQDAVALLRYLADPLSNLRAAAFLRSRMIRLSDRAVAMLAPDLADAIVGAEPGAIADFNEDDRRVLVMLRQAVPRWLASVDRVTPLELLNAVLSETAYFHELEGPGERQERENLKKLRGMVARFQNRGYATLARVAEHLDQLSVGDESNAAVDATDAISLMTVHAAKGLEFPIVFVVNLGRGTGGMRAPIRVAADSPAGPSVSIADYQSEADEDALARDREETKRLLYVALTRARDRLYLSTTVREGVCRMGRGSLGEVLPTTMRDAFIEAAGRPPYVAWRTAGGYTHEFDVGRRWSVVGSAD